MVQAGFRETEEEKVLSVDHRVVETNYGLSSPNPLLTVPLTLIKGADAKGAGINSHPSIHHFISFSYFKVFSILTNQ
ncbi:hypothetical protein Syun_023096 [Stephania yunnanensis]|uniref:Uncharacterized protein n=1 Tax=Stephania yunnanensis TaxID=152371 RepID=A0AAP0I391_9MAGN